MDRRQKKSRDAIFAAFSRLLEKKRFHQITVQEIIDEANVGRSTFYSHFETKEALLEELCAMVFNHVFDQHLSTERSHDFSGGDVGLTEKLTHLLYHIRDNEGNLAGLMMGESSDLFIRYFQNNLSVLFEQFPQFKQVSVPEDFRMHYLTGSFTETVRWWIGNKMKDEPEAVIGFYMQMA